MSVLLDYWLDLTTVCLLKLQKKIFPKLTHIFGIPFFELIDKNILEIWFTDRLWKYKSQMVNYVAMYVVKVMWHRYKMGVWRCQSVWLGSCDTAERVAFVMPSFNCETVKLCICSEWCLQQFVCSSRAHYCKWMNSSLYIVPESGISQVCACFVLVLGWVTVFGQIYYLGICNQPTRSTRPCLPPESLNRVPALAGVKVGMSPLLGVM